MAERKPARRGLDLLVRPERAEAAWWRAWTQGRCETARRNLFDRYRKLAESMASTHYAKRPPGTQELGDVRHLAYEGLLQAIGRFDPARAVPFSAFARPRIAGNINNGLASMSEAAAQYSHLRRAERDRMRSLAPSPAAPDDALSELSGLASLIALGLILESRDPLDPDELAADEPDAYESLAWRDMQERLSAAIARLGDREAYVLTQHYRNGVSFVQIAELLRLTKGRISQIHRGALNRLREILGDIE